ncbi:MAG: oligosaccharide repeat unit polymerase [Verrucomicrobiales bacterium]|jgi:oligosaccharide repeat unit polymerase
MTDQGNTNASIQDARISMRPTAAGNFVLLLGLLIAYATIQTDLPSLMASRVARIVGGFLIASFLVEIQQIGLRRMIRIDAAALAAFYLLTLAEFLITQPALDVQVSSSAVETGLALVILGMAALTIGRSLVPFNPHRKSNSSLPELTQTEIFAMTILCFIIGHLHMVIAVGFSPIALFRELTDPRFAQDWARGQVGSWSALLYELNLLTYLIPPAGAMLLSRWKTLPLIWMPVLLAMLAFVFFSGFSQGSRYVFAVHLITFSAALLLSMKRLTLNKVILLVTPALTILIAASFFTLEFRRIGLREYVSRILSGTQIENVERELSVGSNLEFMVDNNLRAISALSEYFPKRHDYLGSEVVIHGLVHPIPRALWPGKPEKLTIMLEEVLGIQGATIAATFVGEGYMAGGLFGVIAFGLVLGFFCGAWNRLGEVTGNQTLLLLYVAGFFWATVAMRSSMWVTVSALPCLALYVYARFVIPILRKPSSDLVLNRKLETDEKRTQK